MLVVKNLPAYSGDIRDVGLVPGWERSAGGEHGNPLQFTCLENPTDRGAWWAIVHTVTKSGTWLKHLSMHTHIITQIQNLRTPENSWLQGTLINKSSSKSLHTYTETKHHPRANKFQSKTFQANSPTMQEHNPEHRNTGGQKSHQTHRHLKTHYWTLHCTPERINPAPPTWTPMQASLTRKPWQANRPTPPTEVNLHNKEEPQTSSIEKSHPNTAT